MRAGGPEQARRVVESEVGDQDEVGGSGREGEKKWHVSKRGLRIVCVPKRDERKSTREWGETASWYRGEVGGERFSRVRVAALEGGDGGLA